MKSKNLLVLVLILTSFLIISCEYKRPFFQSEISGFLKDLSDTYSFIDKTKKFRSQKGISLQIFFDSQSEAFDDGIYEDIRLFFTNKENQEKIIDDYGPTPSSYPAVYVDFVDASEACSHFIKSDKSASKDIPYSVWHEPTYFNQIE